MNISKIIKQLDKRDFYKTVFGLQYFITRTPHSSEVGTDALPGNERIRFKAAQHLGYPGSDIESIRVNSGADNIKRLEIAVNYMGLTGPSSALPSHYTELVMKRSRLKDLAIREFFDLFNHRLISLDYRAWEKYQFGIQYGRSVSGKASPMDQVLRALTGAKNDVDVFFGGLFAMQNRHVSGLRQILELLCGCEINIKEFSGKWMTLAKTEQTRLGAASQPEGQHAQLGKSTIIGKKVWDLSSAIDIELCVSDSNKAAELMNESGLLSVLKQVAGHYVPLSVTVKWHLATTYRNLPVINLTRSSAQLGFGGALMMRRDFIDEKIIIPIG
ncbi:type VI secretion system baseplate subunit TssG [Photobacterium lutimaris]|uniref:Type VI secretion system baseplate subunit TssG n=1 Tax=Photobacterium lutimaris TaxID=388278 RepID=A0A2T3IZL1_9GAMM|nr:type VI secretion system baseplate subunit TssG [Photobacterium lutimaris]PSU34138.1 type VI secretion system baseplate subunit TssG [Photobacterium lutimaris]TDR75711.1 type VI secretion system protein ImpH [Photobacterium lutimaris]